MYGWVAWIGTYLWLILTWVTSVTWSGTHVWLILTWVTLEANNLWVRVSILTLCFIEIFSDSVSNIWKYNLYFEQQCGCNTKKRLKIPKGGNQNTSIEEEQTTQWPKEKGQKDKQWSTKHTHKTKDRVTRTPLKTEVIS
jgi:hypothetical protein